MDGTGGFVVVPDILSAGFIKRDVCLADCEEV